VPNAGWAAAAALPTAKLAELRQRSQASVTTYYNSYLKVKTVSIKTGAPLSIVAPFIYFYLFFGFFYLFIVLFFAAFTPPAFIHLSSLRTSNLRQFLLLLVILILSFALEPTYIRLLLRQ
jgi:hypothetical protein